ncbi:MAG: hypothetical protein AAF585_19785 [Verrucomicrobiota bacterium]
MKPNAFLTTAALLAAGALFSSAWAQDALKVAVPSIKGDDGAVNKALTEALSEAEFEVIDLAEVDEAVTAAKVPETGIDAVGAKAIGKGTGAQVVVVIKKTNVGLVAQILSVKSDFTTGGLAPNADALPQLVIDAINNNAEMLLADPS